jgi:hypothetical protein
MAALIGSRGICSGNGGADREPWDMQRDVKDVLVEVVQRTYMAPQLRYRFCHAERP